MLFNIFNLRLSQFGCIFMALLSVICPAYANLPVIDTTNLVQNTLTAEQAVAAVNKQIKQYQTQLQQYQNMLQNSLAPPGYIWDQVNITINHLLEATDTLDYYKNQAGSIQNYLARYQDVNYYRTSPCFTAAGCTAAQRQALIDAQASGSEAEKRANDAMLLGIAQQQDSLRRDSQNLMQLQQQVSGVQGRMQALQAANQLASAQANQLFQIRALLVAQQNAEATRAQIVADKEAQQAAAQQQLLKGSFEKSPPISW